MFGAILVCGPPALLFVPRLPACYINSARPCRWHPEVFSESGSRCHQSSVNSFVYCLRSEFSSRSDVYTVWLLYRQWKRYADVCRHCCCVQLRGGIIRAPDKCVAWRFLDSFWRLEESVWCRCFTPGDIPERYLRERERESGVQSVESFDVGEPSGRTGAWISGILELLQVEYLQSPFLLQIAPVLSPVCQRNFPGKEKSRELWRRLQLQLLSVHLDLMMNQLHCPRD